MVVLPTPGRPLITISIGETCWNSSDYELTTGLDFIHANVDLMTEEEQPVSRSRAGLRAAADRRLAGFEGETVIRLFERGCREARIPAIGKSGYEARDHIDTSA